MESAGLAVGPASRTVVAYASVDAGTGMGMRRLIGSCICFY